MINKKLYSKLKHHKSCTCVACHGPIMQYASVENAMKKKSNVFRNRNYTLEQNLSFSFLFVISSESEKKKIKIKLMIVCFQFRLQHTVYPYPLIQTLLW